MLELIEVFCFYYMLLKGICLRIQTTFSIKSDIRSDFEFNLRKGQLNTKNLF